ncbi:MAG: hypothetical protein V3V52_10545 [Candidatus Adiutricales bacterium]
MSKNQKRITHQPGQQTIFDLITAKSQEKNDYGSLRVVDELKAALTHALKSSLLPNTKQVDHAVDIPRAKKMRFFVLTEGYIALDVG